jgi:hypothetical protein
MLFSENQSYIVKKSFARTLVNSKTPIDKMNEACLKKQQQIHGYLRSSLCLLISFFKLLNKFLRLSWLKTIWLCVEWRMSLTNVALRGFTCKSECLETWKNERLICRSFSNGIVLSEIWIGNPKIVFKFKPRDPLPEKCVSYLINITYVCLIYQFLLIWQRKVEI